MDGNTKPEEKTEGIQGESHSTQGQEALGWRVTDEEIERVIKKLEEGWGF